MTGIPFRFIGEAIRIASKLSENNTESPEWQAALVLVGVFSGPKHHCSLPWSPLHSDADASELPLLGRKWIFDKISRMISTLHEHSRQTWTMEWPRSCSFYLTHGMYSSTLATWHRG
jgi:hypothetical protein